MQVALTEAVKVAETLLVDQVITSELPSTISVASLSSTGYNYELVRLLVEYGAIGDSGSSLAESILGSEYHAFTGTGTLSAAPPPQTISLIFPRSRVQQHLGILMQQIPS